MIKEGNQGLNHNAYSREVLFNFHSFTSLLYLFLNDLLESQIINKKAGHFGP